MSSEVVSAEVLLSSGTNFLKEAHGGRSTGHAMPVEKGWVKGSNNLALQKEREGRDSSHLETGVRLQGLNGILSPTLLLSTHP